MSEAERRRGIGRPRSIDRDKIVAAAHRLGLEGLTMRAIAEHLGVTTQALYNHIGGRRELLLLLANDHSELFETSGELDQAEWRPWLTSFAHALREHLRHQPGLAAAVVTQGPTTAAALRFAERTVEKMGDAGFTAEASLRAYRIVLEFVVSWSQRHDQPQSGPEAAEPTSPMVSGEIASPSWPVIVQAWSADLDELFSFGLEALLDGLSVRTGNTVYRPRGVPIPDLPRQRPAPP